MIVSKCVFYFFKIFGLATMRLDENETVRDSWCSGSKKGQVYNAILTCSIIASNCYVARLVYKENLSHREFEKTFDVVQYVYTTVTVAVILTVFCFCQGRAVLIANNLRKTYVLVENINSQMSKKEEDPVISGLKRIWITSTVIWISVVFTTSKLQFAVVMYYMTVYPCILIVNCAFLQYTIILHLLKQLFTILNANFLYVSTRQSVVTRKVEAAHSSFQAAEQSSQQFSDLRRLYMLLCDLSMDVSKFYHLIMLFCVTYVFSTLTMWLYYITAPLVTGTTPSKLQYIHSLMIVTYHIFMLIILTKSVDAVVQEKNKRTGEITNGWLANLQNQQLINELNLFSNYLLHKNVSFTAYGLFSLDESLLMSITGSITTYLVILLQFQ
ncbi:gustatory receptor 20 isoform X1 [Nasonia vitripennis]|uniref:Gustatory receptor n=1 Tax=Nasonia vitripennis TaxID=7425 RepID=A0A7M7QG53_NASVI|nr:gustatory receptor 20 [Nasonia vitripennis]XP_031786125.1 gustatory receptor 20 isoform X1 [Nasonia vitripennis]